MNTVDTKILPSSVLTIKPVRPQRDTVERIKNEILDGYRRRRATIESEREEAPVAESR